MRTPLFFRISYLIVIVLALVGIQTFVREVTIDTGEISLGTTIHISDLQDSEYQYYTVRSGDTLSSLSENFQIEMSQLIEINHFTGTETLRIGQVIRLSHDLALYPLDFTSPANTTLGS
ncbi:MAG: LysM peptidoglycan-binding domain-containing protein [Anaerolineales bacterium]|nr:LysM peptidoglycan-binding domain-containing protein [Anaerolineales bacterium]